MGNQQRQVDSHERTMQALELRKAGASYDRIAQTLEYADAQGAFEAVKRALKQTLREPAEALRTVEEERIDAALGAIWSAVTNGSYGAIDRFIRLSERRAKLRGLDAPAQLALSGGLENTNAEYVDIFVHDSEVDQPAKQTKQAKTKIKAGPAKHPVKGGPGRVTRAPKDHLPSEGIAKKVARPVPSKIKRGPGGSAKEWVPDMDAGTRAIAVSDATLARVARAATKQADQAVERATKAAPQAGAEIQDKEDQA